MIEMNIEVKGLDQLKKAWEKRPALVKEYLNKAVEASVFEIEKNAIDSNFQFRTPRSKRTGYLQRSFKFGIVTKDLYGAIGPTAGYAPRVHESNPFMARIARASQPYVQKHFGDALKFIVEGLVK